MSETHPDGTKAIPPSHAAADVVLVVDDEPTITDALELLLQEAGYQVVVAHNGSEALQRIQELWPRVIISDVMMPVMDGPALIAAVQRHATERQAPMPGIILMTAASTRAVAGLAIDVFVPKPFDIARIEAAVQALMSHERS